MKKLLTAVVGFFVSASAFCQGSYIHLEPKAVPTDKSYVMNIGGYDWGPACDWVLVNCGDVFPASYMNAADFTVDVVYKTEEGYGMVRGSRNVKAAYLTDENGKPTERDSKYLKLELEYGKDVEYSDPYVGLIASKVVRPMYDLRIRNEKMAVNITKCSGRTSPLAGQFRIDEAHLNEITLRYAHWEPAVKKMGTPLIVWFHGVAEGGSNPYKPLLGTKAANLISKDIQKFFPDGACVIAAQSPTAWLETTTVDINGMRVWEPVDSLDNHIEKVTKPISKFLNKFFVAPESSVSEDDESEPYAAVSYYTEIMKKIIDDYIAANPYIDPDKIYAGGCSAGGYMTLNMCIQYPGFFAAAFPTCEAYLDSKITSEQMEQLARLPMWFTYAKNDTVMNPETHCEPTIRRLRNAGARDLHVSAWDDVGEYDGHSSWIYVLNDQCSDEGMTLFQWLSTKKR